MSFFKDTVRSLFGIVFVFVGIWTLGKVILIWYDDHLIIKEVVKEKEKIVYVEKESIDGKENNFV